MNVYKYSFYKNNKLVYKKIKSPNVELCKSYLENNDIKVESINLTNTILDKISLINIGSSIKERDLVFILNNLSVLLESGLRLPSSLEVLIKEVDNQNVKSLLMGIYYKVIEGALLSEAMRYYEKDFPKILIELIKSGELTSNLSAILKSASEYFDTKTNMKKEIFSIFKMPLLYITLSNFVSIFMLITVFPVYRDLYNSLEVELPSFLNIFFKVSDNLLKYKFLYLFILLIIAFGVFYLFKNSKTKRKIDYLLTKTPVINKVLRLYYQTYISKTVNELIKSKLNILDALLLTKPTIKNNVYNDLLNNMIEAIYSGNTLSSVINKSVVLDTIFIKMVGVSEVSGNVSYCFESLNKYFEKTVFNEITRLKSRIEPVLMLLVYSYIVLLVMAVMIPSLSVMGQI